MKKYQSLTLLLLLVLCAVSPSYAQIRVIGSGEELIEEDSDLVIEDPAFFDREAYEAHLARLRSMSLDQYADQIAQTLLDNLEGNCSAFNITAEEYTPPTVDEIKSSFYAQAASFEVEGAGSDTLLGDFCDEIAKTLAAKIAALNGAERRLLGIYLNVSEEDTVKNLSQQVIWMLESMTTQKYYDEFHSIMWQYIREPFIEDECLSADGIPIPTDDLKR